MRSQVEPTTGETGPDVVWFELHKDWWVEVQRIGFTVQGFDLPVAPIKGILLLYGRENPDKELRGWNVDIHGSPPPSLDIQKWQVAAQDWIKQAGL